jgi:hypothetical protein
VQKNDIFQFRIFCIQVADERAPPPGCPHGGPGFAGPGPRGLRAEGEAWLSPPIAKTLLFEAGARFRGFVAKETFFRFSCRDFYNGWLMCHHWHGTIGPAFATDLACHWGQSDANNKWGQARYNFPWLFLRLSFLPYVAVVDAFAKSSVFELNDGY